MARTIKKGRDAVTGRFVPDSYVEKHPNTTVTESIKVGPVKHRK